MKNQNSRRAYLPYILILDSDESATGNASESLINAGYACGWVTTSHAAFELLKWRVPDLLLLDWDMPKEGKSTVFDQLRRDTRFRDLPIVALSARSGSQDERLARGCGVADYIYKPIDPETLVQRVDKALEFQADRQQPSQNCDQFKVA